MVVLSTNVSNAAVLCWHRLRISLTLWYRFVLVSFILGAFSFVLVSFLYVSTYLLPSALECRVVHVVW